MSPETALFLTRSVGLNGDATDGRRKWTIYPDLNAAGLKKSGGDGIIERRRMIYGIKYST